MAEHRILTVSELAGHLNVHRITIYRLLKSGSLPGFKIGRVWRFDLDEIGAWMQSGKAARDAIEAAETEVAVSVQRAAATDGARPSADGVRPAAVSASRPLLKKRK